MVSSRDRIRQRHCGKLLEPTARAPPPAFLFPNQQCQRPEPLLSGATRLAPGVGGGGYLSNLEFRVKSFFPKLSDPTSETQKPDPPEPAASKETTKTSQAIISKNNQLFRFEILGRSFDLLRISRRAASNEAELLSQPTFLFSTPSRPGSLQSAKTTRGAPRRSAASSKGFD
jgi:hypothetical protein